MTDTLFSVPYILYIEAMRFPWSRPKKDIRQADTPEDNRRVVDDGVAAFFNSVAPQKSPLSGLTPRKDISHLWPQAVSHRADSAEQMAERRIRLWVMEQEAQARATRPKNPKSP